MTFCTHDWPNYVGGINTWLIRLAPDLRRRGIEVRVLFFADRGSPKTCPTIMALRSQGFDCPAVDTQVYVEDRVRWLLKNIKQDPPDVFVPNFMLPAYFAGRWVHEAGIPTVGVLHSYNSYYSWLLSEFKLGDIRYRPSALVCVSKFIEQEVIRQIPNGVITRRIPCGVPIPQDIAQPPTGRMRLIYTGRLAEEAKRISELTRALCRVVREIPNVEAFIYGDGPAAPAVKQIIASEGNGLPVYMAGRVESDQVLDHLLASHALVLLSDYEGLPMSVMEAMACGVVPICLRTQSGAPELIENGKTGLLVSDRGDDFVNAVRRLQCEPESWERLSRAARAKIEAEYSSEECTRRWEALLSELSESSRIKRPVQIPRRPVLPPIPSDMKSGHMNRPPILLLITRGIWRRLRLIHRLLKKK